MSINKNIEDSLNDGFKNHDYLPQPLLLEDLDIGAKAFFDSLNLSIRDENQNAIPVPIVFLNQERWAELKNNWKSLRDEGGREMTMPFMTMGRLGVKPAESPYKRGTIPSHRLFPYLKVPVISEGKQIGIDIYKVPQPKHVDISYELRFFSHYMQHVNKSYESMLYHAFSDGQAYIKINGYYMHMTLESPSEENSMDDIEADRRYQVIYPITLHGKLIDPALFEKVKTITKIDLNFGEQTY